MNRIRDKLTLIFRKNFYKLIQGYISKTKNTNFKAIWISGCLSFIGFYLYFCMEQYRIWELAIGIICAVICIVMLTLYFIAAKYHAKHYIYTKDEHGNPYVTYVKDTSLYNKQNQNKETSTQNNNTSSEKKEKASNIDDSKFDATINYFDGCENAEQVKERYRKLMKIYHPDVTAGSTVVTEQINEQYQEILKNLV